MVFVDGWYIIMATAGCMLYRSPTVHGLRVAMEGLLG